MTDNNIHIRFTDAPESYDYSNTSTVAVVGTVRSGMNKGGPLRKVAIRTDYSLAYQTGRYQSGCNMCLTLEQLEDCHDVIGNVDLALARKEE